MRFVTPSSVSLQVLVRLQGLIMPSEVNTIFPNWQHGCLQGVVDEKCTKGWNFEQIKTISLQTCGSRVSASSGHDCASVATFR